MQRPAVVSLLLTLLLAAPLAAQADAQADAKASRALADIGFCYAVSAVGASTVNRRNDGMTLEEQVASRAEKLDEAQAALAADLARQVYENDLRDPLAVASDTNRACLKARGNEQGFDPGAVALCPRIGLMRAEVDALRRAGKTAEDVVAMLGERYAGVRQPLGGGLQEMAAEEVSGDQPNTGAFDNQLCMILGVTGR